VATVGPYRITLGNVLTLTRDREKSAMPPSPATPVEVVRQRIRNSVLDQMIERRLLVLGAAAHPEWVSDPSCEQEVQKQLVSLGPEEVERRRKLAGVSKDDFLDQFRRFIREELMKREVLRREVHDRVAVSTEEIHQRYVRDKETLFHRPDSWAVHHIEQYLPRERVAELPDLIKSLEVLREEVSHAIESGESPQARAEKMSPYVRTHSQASDAKSGYAYIYDRPEVQFDPELKKRIREATVGELSPVFELAGDEKRTGACFYLVFERKEGVYTQFEQAERIIRADLLKEKTEELQDVLMDRLRAAYPVKIFEEHLYDGIPPPGG
jgi:hypothetical protein